MIFFSGEENRKQNNLRNITIPQFVFSLVQKKFTESFQADITIKIAQHAESRLVQTKLKTKEYEIDPKTTNGN